jgi:hypothetical protein
VSIEVLEDIEDRKLNLCFAAVKVTVEDRFKDSLIITKTN